MSETKEEGMYTVLDYLTSVPAWYLATCEGDQPHVRPFSFAAVEGGRICFCTANTKDVYRELVANPKFEVSAWRHKHGWLILRGRADFSLQPSESLRRAGYEHLSALGESYEGPDDPRLAFFTVEAPEAWICRIDGSWNPLEL